MSTNAIWYLLDAAEKWAVERYTIGQLDDAVEFVRNVQVLTGAQSISPDFDDQQRRGRILHGMALSMYRGDEAKASSFVSGFSWNRTALGFDVAFDDTHDRDAWQAGREADPGRKKHEAAQAAATAAFQAKFARQTAPNSPKERNYWIKQYSKEMKS